MHRTGAAAMTSILILENDPDVLSIIAECLSALGHRVFRAASVGEARGVLTIEKIDLVLSDILMVGDRGDLVIGAAVDAGIPAVAMTGDADAYERLAGGTLTVLAKPFRLSELEAIIARLLPHAAGKNLERPRPDTVEGSNA